MVAADTFRFLNEVHRVEARADWNHPRRDALWLYNLHYFDDLCAEGASERAEWHRSLILRWIEENPIGHGIGWDPYPISLRIVNWIKWGLSGGELGERAVESLAVQARYLARRFEWHLLGNHLFANAKALVSAGCFFDGAEAQAWLKKSCRILAAQLDEQVLADGGHLERSTMYHAIVLEDVLDLVNLSKVYADALPAPLVAALRATATRMLHWARTMTHPDGEIAFFNDAALGIAPTTAELERYATALGVAAEIGAPTRLADLSSSGYVRLQEGPIVVLFDAAPVGPDYLPGHAHADTLAFELSWAGQRVICNSGTSRYGTGAERLWQRSTAAHNTVEIDGENSSEVWCGFRVARRAYPLERQCVQGKTVLRVSCAHDGYMRLPGRPVHRRTLQVSGDSVTWTDEVAGAGVHRAIARIPLHPDMEAQRTSDSAWRLRTPSGRELELSVEGPGATLDAEEGRYSPEFGLTVKRTVLVWDVTGTLPISITTRIVDKHEGAAPTVGSGAAAGK